VLETCALHRTGPPVEGVDGGMGLKLVAAREALAGGVARVRIADGRCAAPLSRALSGAGTNVVLRPDPAVDPVVGPASSVSLASAASVTEGRPGIEVAS
jgi:acetylglutamate/LysW-gamma-L-alpha-aminoadipate kinase